MSFRPYAMRGRSDYDQAATETAAREALQQLSPHEEGFRSPSAKQEKRRRIALAKTFRGLRKVSVGGRIRQVVRVCERTGNVFLAGKNGREEAFSPYMLERLT